MVAGRGALRALERVDEDVVQVEEEVAGSVAGVLRAAWIVGTADRSPISFDSRKTMFTGIAPRPCGFTCHTVMFAANAGSMA